MPTQAEKGRLFRERHANPGILILPNPWDAGTAKLLQSLGFEALATTSLGMSNALGRADEAAHFDDVAKHIHADEGIHRTSS